MKRIHLFSIFEAVEQWPLVVRCLLGCCAAGVAQGLTYWITPLRPFPAALAFPAIILSVWFLGMWGGIFCTLAEAALVDLFMVKTPMQLTNENAPEELRMAIFLALSILLGWMMRLLGRQRIQLNVKELQKRLILAQTERQLAEERARISNELRGHDEVLQTALQANDMGLWVWDLLRGTAYYSDDIFRMAGLVGPKTIDPLSSTWQQYIHPEDEKRVKDAVLETRAGHQDYHQQYRVILPDGSMHWLESQGKCLRDSSGRPTRVVGVLADVTHRKLIEETMLRTEKLAVAGRLAASVAHEINNPLEAIGNLLYLISISTIDADVQSYAHSALDELMRVSQITQQTLKFHRQTGSPTITKLSEVVAVVVAMFSPRLRSAGISTHMRTVRETDICCLPGEMQQIFANLVSNAIDAMPQGGHLSIVLRSSRNWRNNPATRGMRITFADTGKGMSRATMRHIFEPFFTTKVATGTGLGLWVVAQLVEHHHGHARVWSSQRAGASGTVFSIFLPFESEQALAETTCGDAASAAGTA
jgi:PAS domain S-box-containing protein